MNEYSIKSSDAIELKFNGELIHQAESIVTLDDDFERKFLIAVYAVDGGGFVSSIEYQTNCSVEQSVLWFEETDSFEDVEKFFYVFDTCELKLPASGLPRDEKEAREQITKSIAKKFEKLMFPFLDELKLAAESHHFGDRTKEPTKSGSMWGLFKTK